MKNSESRRMVDITRDKPIKVAVRVVVPVRDHPKVSTRFVHSFFARRFSAGKRAASLVAAGKSRTVLPCVFHRLAASASFRCTYIEMRASSTCTFSSALRASPHPTSASVVYLTVIYKIDSIEIALPFVCSLLNVSFSSR